MALAWDSTHFTMPDAALSVDHEGIGITAVIKDGYTVISWGVNVRGTWADAEEVAKDAAEVLSRYLGERYEFTPEGTPPDG